MIISQGSDCFSSVINRLENIETPFSRFYSYDMERSVRVSFSITCYMHFFIYLDRSTLFKDRSIYFFSLKNLFFSGAT